MTLRDLTAARWLADRVPRVVDVRRSERFTIYVTGSARSGTTWVAEALSQPRTARLVFEPLHHRSRYPEAGHFRSVADADERLVSYVRDVLRGARSDGWLDGFQPRGVFVRRVVKDIRPGLLPVVRAVASTVPVVHVVRHPLDVATSRIGLDGAGSDWWDTAGALEELDRLDGDDRRVDLADLARTMRRELRRRPADEQDVVDHVAIWCVENALALEAHDEHSLIARSEDLRSDPADEFASLAAHCGVAPIDLDLATRPSRTTFATRRRGPVDPVDPGRAAELMAATLDFGVGDWYGTSAPPLRDD